MPDIPFDYLIILLLLVASLLGRIFQKKKEGQDTPSPEPFQPNGVPQDEEEVEQPRQVDLGEALRDFWQKAQQSAQPQPEPEPAFEIEEPPPPLLHQQFHETDVVQKAHSADDADDNRVRQHMEEAQHKVESDHYEKNCFVDRPKCHGCLAGECAEATVATALYWYKVNLD